jgi:hypothetical protein
MAFFSSIPSVSRRMAGCCPGRAPRRAARLCPSGQSGAHLGGGLGEGSGHFLFGLLALWLVAALWGQAWAGPVAGPVSGKGAGSGAGPAHAAGPARNFWVEFRWVTESQLLGGSGGRGQAKTWSTTQAAEPSPHSWGTASASSGPELALHGQLLAVMNGQRSSLRWERSFPVLWLQSAQAAAPQGRALPGSPPGGAWGANGPGISQGLVWQQSGFGLTVLAQWPGGQQPVMLELEWDEQGQPSSSAAAPSGLAPQQDQQRKTVLAVPLDQWVTAAVSPPAPQSQAGTVSSRRALEVAAERRVLQVRVRLN